MPIRPQGGRAGACLLAIALLSASAPLARAQAPSELFALSGNKVNRFVRTDERVARDTRVNAEKQELRDKTASLQSARSKRASGTFDAAQIHADSLRAHVLRMDVRAAQDSTKTEDDAAQKAADDADWLPALDTSMRLTGKGDVQDRLLAAGRLLYDVPFKGAKNSHLTVFGNIGTLVTPDGPPNADTIQVRAEAIRSSKQGMFIGVAPWYNLNTPDGNFTVVPNLTFGGRTERVKALNGTDLDFSQAILGAGVSIGLGYIEGQAHPMGISISVEESWFSEADYVALLGAEHKRDHLVSGRAVALLPINGAGTGVLFETVFTRSLAPAWQVGLAYTKKSKKDESGGKKKG